MSGCRREVVGSASHDRTGMDRPRPRRASLSSTKRIDVVHGCALSDAEIRGVPFDADGKTGWGVVVRVCATVGTRCYRSGRNASNRMESVWLGVPPRFESTRWLLPFSCHGLYPAVSLIYPLFLLFLFCCCLVVSRVREVGIMNSMMAPIASHVCTFVCYITIFSRVDGALLLRNRPSLQSGLPSVGPAFRVAIRAIFRSK